MYRLVVVDDETKIRDGIVNLFPWSNIGFEIVGSFANGQQAIDYILRNPVDVVLTDIKMPIMDGIQLAERLAANTRIKIVFLTGYQDFDLLKKAIRIGVNDYLVKPVKYDELLTCFEKVQNSLNRENNVRPEERSFSYYSQITDIVSSYIQDNIKDASLEQAATIVSLSPGHLSRVFKENAGLSFSECLMRARMNKAAELLHNINLKLYEIAYQVGYDNPKNFSRAFKQYFHMTPREYREQGTAKRD